MGHLPPVQKIADCPIASEMDPSKILPDSEECSSSESGWTTYIASPDLQHDQAEDEDDEENGSIAHQVFKKKDEADSDDSMTSDASSGPSDQRYSHGYLARNLGFGYAGKKDIKNYVAKKQNQQEEKKKKKRIEGEQENSGNRGNSVGRLKKY